MKSEQFALFGFSDHPDESDSESIDGEDLPPNQVMEDPVNEHVVGEENGSSIVHPGGLNLAGQSLVITESADGSEILIFLENDPALSQHLLKQNASVNSIESGICDVNLSEEDSKQKDNTNPNEDDSKQRDIGTNEKDPEEDNPSDTRNANVINTGVDANQICQAVGSVVEDHFEIAPEPVKDTEDSFSIYWEACLMEASLNLEIQGKMEEDAPKASCSKGVISEKFSCKDNLKSFILKYVRNGQQWDKLIESSPVKMKDVS
ncbi:hypothetical protein HNY73_003050 [Argiope bruennichi]|uniref:Uncharacterized protein n=1 Tax=Argiope bruennichi TaxID=94029 RepID=A0A8T0FVP9_ARGBR|nr:hypothetical protein HNY73_003050 [Argiope bruennichi]